MTTMLSHLSRVLAVPAVVACLLFAGGCASLFPKPPQSEAEVLGPAVQMTSGFSKAGEAYFSRDMRWFIFQAGDPYQMYVAPVKWENGQIVGGGTPVRISPEPSRNTCGDFSPDGRSIIFASTAGQDDPATPAPGYQREGRNYRWSYPKGMDIFRADGWQGAIAAADPARGVNLAQHKLTTTPGYDAEGSFSPDGKWIVFSSVRDDDASSDPAPATKPAGELLNNASAPASTQPHERRPNIELYAMKADGTNVVRLTHQPGYDGGPFFSPDGKRVVYRSDRKGNDLLQVYVADLTFDAAGNITGIANEKQLTNDGNVNWGPYWHPDGQHIVYASSAVSHANYELFLMRADGKKSCRITFTNGADVLPVFSPDGKWLLWTSKRTKDNTTQIFAAPFTMPAYVK
jgi:Tol biopolymer transport system component